MTDVDRTIDAATQAGETAYQGVRAMPASQDKADSAGRLSRNLRDVADRAAGLQHDEILRAYLAERPSYGELAKRFGVSKTLIARIVSGAEEAAPARPSTRPEPEVIVSAIVTSGRKVLFSRRRNEPDLPWAFIGGKIGPGESPADAAVREVKEETGLRIAAGHEIGRRIHPVTRRWVVYIAATPEGGTDVFVGDTEELAEVRWVTPAEADKLTGNTIYEPVRKHLRRRS